MARQLFVLFCLNVGLAILTAAVAEGATIRGTVTDAETGERLAYVSVLLRGETPQGGVISTGRATDEGGDYVFNDLVPGFYRLRFIYIGYDVLADSVRVDTDREYRIDAALPVRPIEMQEVVVEADRLSGEREIQTGFVNLDIKTLGAIPSIGETDPIRSLQLLPGVQTASDISSGLYIRGGGPDQNLVLLDNVPVYNPTHAFGFFSTFNADAIDDVTLYKGAYPAQYGGRLGAVLDVAGREAAAPKISGIGGVSTISSRLTLEGPVGTNHWILSGRRTYLEPILSVLRNDDNQIPSYYFYDVNGKFTTRRDEDWVVLNGYNGQDDIRVGLDADSYIHLEWGNTVLSAGYNKLFSENLLAEVLVSGSEYKSRTDVTIFTTKITVDNRLRDLSVRGDLDWNIGQRHRIGAGVKASGYEFLYRQEFNADPQINFDRRPYELSSYVEDQWRPRTGTAIRIGLRARYISDGERVLWEPRGSFSQVLPGNLRFKFGGGIYNQYLQLVTTEGFSAGDFYLPIDETTQPGRSQQAVVGLAWDATRRYQVSIEGYYTNLGNLVSFDNTTAADATGVTAEALFFTNGKGYATGAEFFVQRRTGNLTGWFGYTLGWTRRTFAELNQGEKFPPKYDRRHDISAVLNYRRGKWSYGGAFLYATGQAFTPAAARFIIRNPATGNLPRDGQLLPADRNSARLLPYHRLDVSVTRDFSLFGLEAQWMVQAFNLYSRRNEWFVQYDTANPETEPEVVKQLPLLPSLGINFKF